MNRGGNNRIHSRRRVSARAMAAAAATLSDPTRLGWGI